MTDNPPFCYVICESLHNIRLDIALAKHPLIRTRSRAAFLIKNGFVLCEKKAPKASQKVSLGETYKVSLPKENSISHLEPSQGPLDIVFEDECIIILNKPSGLVVHPSPGHYADTLVHRLLFHTKNLSMGFGEFRPGIVHRLDKDTSGLMVVCKTDLSHEKMALQFKSKSARRRYWAIVLGQLTPLKDTITSYMGRHPTHRKKMASLLLKNGEQPGKKAVTHYQVLKTHHSKLTWVECDLETGRTHQIRVHLAGKGFPILQDPIYGSSKSLSLKKLSHVDEHLFPPPRMVLHAHQLAIKHPLSGENLLYNSDWPKDLKPFANSLNFISPS